MFWFKSFEALDSILIWQQASAVCNGVSTIKRSPISVLFDFHKSCLIMGRRNLASASVKRITVSAQEALALTAIQYQDIHYSSQYPRILNISAD